MRLTTASILVLCLAVSGCVTAQDQSASQRQGHTQTANAPDLESVELFATGIFVDRCVLAMPTIQNVIVAINRHPGNEVSTEAGAKGAEAIGINARISDEDYPQRKFFSRVLVSEELSVPGGVVTTDVIFGSIDVGQGAQVSVCSVSAPGVAPDALVAAMEGLLERGPDEGFLIENKDGFETRWRNWNTTGSAKGIEQLAVIWPVIDDDELLIFPRFLAVGYTK